MHFSRATEYALLGLAYLAGQPNRAVSAQEIAHAEKLSVYFFRNIFQKLKAAQLVKSQRGRGYILAQPPRAISLRSVLEAVEGPVNLHACLEQKNLRCQHACGCKILQAWERIQHRFLADLSRIRLNELT